MEQLHHRDHFRAPVYAPFSVRAALSASIIAGLVFAVLDAGLGWVLRGISPLTPLRMIGAIVLGPAALSPPDTFDATIALVAIATHLLLSAAYGTLLALLMPAVDIAWGLLLGGSTDSRSTTSISMALTPSTVVRGATRLGKRRFALRVWRCPCVYLYGTQQTPGHGVRRSGNAFAVRTQRIRGRIGFKRLRLGPEMR